MTGRGFGKTRSGAEWVIERAQAGNKDRWIALIGATPEDVRKYQIEEGPSSILKNSPPWFTPAYYPARGGGLLVWPNGARASVFSAAKPGKVRGFSGDTAWIDEFAKFGKAQELLDLLLFGLREERVSTPKICITTTPKPLPVLLSLAEEATRSRDIRLISGSSYENLENLSRTYRKILARYEGTDLAAQEIEGQLLTEMQGALWRRAWIDGHRIPGGAPPAELDRIVVAVDPPGTSRRSGAEAGIVVAGRQHRAGVPHLVLLADVSLRGTPQQWGAAAVDAYHAWHADALLGEANYGGEMVENTIRTIAPTDERPGGRDVAFVYVNATRGKAVRAQPISALYQQGRGHHCGVFAQLEAELCTWEPNADPPMPSPNRLDALVWAGTDLVMGPAHDTGVMTPLLRRGEE